MTPSATEDLVADAAAEPSSRTSRTSVRTSPAPAPRLSLRPEPRRALVTGGAGYFGGIFARYLADREIEVVSLDRLADPDPDPRIVEVVADLRHAEEVSAVLGDLGPFDAIFHCAAVMGHESRTPQELWDCNVTGTEILADAAIAAGVRKLVCTSSDCVFGRPFDRPVDEDEPVCPIEAYGRSKVEAERILAGRADRLEVDVLRCPMIVSAGRLGIVAILFEFAREGRRIYLVGDGSNRHSFIHALDLAEACLLAARAPGSHLYHVGGDDVSPLREVYAGVIEEAESSSRLVRLPRAPARAALSLLHRIGVSPLGPYHARLISGSFVFDTTRIKDDLGWRPTRTHEDMLREAYRFYAGNEAERSDELSATRQGAKLGILRLVKLLS
jgi:UDP-glucose 4-epimerase